MDPVSEDTIRTIWIVTLTIYGVVVLIVAALLTLIVREARRIRAGVSEIWNVGQRIANNTVHISLLEHTNRSAGKILSSAVGVLGATAAIHEHAESCPGCPACVLGHRWAQ